MSEVGLHGRKPSKKPLISKVNVKKRLDFAKTYVNHTIEYWKNLLFSDESKFNLYNNDSRGYVRRSINSAFNPKYTIKTVKFNRGSIMVWGCFSWYEIGPLHRINNIMDQIQYRNILQTVMLSFAKKHFPVDN